MGRKGTVRKDFRRVCPECGLGFRPCNLDRHINAAHPDSPHVNDRVRERIREALRAKLIR